MYLRAEQIKKEIKPLVQHTLQRLSDHKQKVREASTNFCLYLAHKDEIGMEFMMGQVLEAVEGIQWEKTKGQNDTFGNSNMLVACLSLLDQYQTQTSLVKQE